MSGAGSVAAVLRDVAAERARQDEKWGGPQHDDQHSTEEFVQLIRDYAAWARVMAGMGSADRARHRLIQAAALAVAAAESIDRRAGEVCGNCETRLPEGCGGAFINEQQCLLARKVKAPNDRGEARP